MARSTGPRASWRSLQARIREAGPWRVAAMGLATVILLAAPVWAWETFGYVVTKNFAFDWRNFVTAGDRIVNGNNPYVFSGPYVFRWSPVAALLFAALTPIGLTAWRWLHILALPAVRDWRMIVIALLSFGFWFDVETGNVMIFTLVAAVYALRGNTIGTWGYLAFFLIAPRPLMVPLVAWLLWKRSNLRLNFVLLAVFHFALVGLVGLLPQWFEALQGATGHELGNLYNLGPSRVIGIWWIPIGILLAIGFTWRGHLGLASLAASPYLLPYYFLMGLLEFVRPADTATQTTAVESS